MIWRLRFNILSLLWLQVCLTTLLFTISSQNDDQRPYHREHCLSDDFKCEDGKCIPHHAKCDGRKDCTDGDDEWSCDLFHCKAPMYFRCANGVCVESHVRCNSDDDCGDWSDEMDCSHSMFDDEDCSHDQFTCEDKICIPKIWVCDGKNDCLDSSDEVPSLCSNQTCKEHEFQCRNKECILDSWRCDGTRDCKDGSDEVKCPRRVVPVEECTLDNRMFLCEDKVLCVELFEVCNNHEDCLDGSDEGRNCSDIGMCHNKCVNSGSECFRTPEGPICGCEKGYTLKNGFCKDIDECQIFGECDQKCKNSAGSYSCLCDPGYVIQRDERSCKAEGGEAMLVYSTTTEVRAFFLTSQIYTHIVDDQLQVVGVAYDGHHVYWTEIFHEEEAIMRAREDGSKMEVIVSAGLGAPEDLAIDWITKNIYFTDSKLQRIGICSNDGLKSTVIHADILDKPRGIALHPKEGLMYWTDWGEHPLIGRSGMDGSEFTKFVNDSLHWPNGIVIDYPNDRLYWVDGKLHTIESIRLDGTDRRKVLEKEIEHPFAIAVFEDSLYWSDWEGNEIEACNKFTGKDRRSILREKKRRIYGIHVFHPVNQNNEGYNPCADAPCSDICLLSPSSKGYTCACPEDKILKNVGDNYCVPSGKQQMLIVASSHTFYELEHKKLGRQVVTEIPIKDVGKVGAITYDPITNSIIMSDTIKREILLLQTESLKLSTVVNSDMGRVEGLAFDHYGNNLYFTDSELGKVEVVSFQTWERKTLLQRLGGDVPTDIAVIPEEGVMFISLFNPQGSRIDKFSMSGNIESRVHVIYNNLHGPYLPLHYDHMLHRIFWADSNNQTIETTDLDGRIRHVFRHLSTKPVSLASIDYDLFWTNENSHRLYWADTVDGSNGNKVIDLDGMQDDETLKLTVVSGKVTDINHPCRINNGNCSHICLLDGHNKVCACPNGMLLNKDGFQCMEVPHCESNQFQCHLSSVAGIAKHCIPITSQCDHVKDCPNGEDELHCSIYRIQCPRGQLSCHDGSKCYDEHKKCDIFFDCPDHSDESYCDSYKKKECDEVAEFQCASGDCIDALQRCDFRKDCADNSDEEGCESTTCKTWQFRCSSGSCITSSWECDHQVDCPDGSDEHPGCVTEVTCGPYQMACSNGQCIDNFLQCNGLSDCDDGSDEEHCPDPLETDDMPRHCDDHNEFPCHYNPGTCVPRSARCNGTNECQGGEDEEGCKMCKENEFSCDNNKCIPSEWVCDKMDDCGDNSDETSTICTEPHNRHHDVSPVNCDGFLCANKEQCLHFTSVCDGVNDCDDKSDEGGKCGYSCENARCVDVCHETPTGPKCDCHSGYTLMGDARTCTDIDECATGQYCSQYCENTLGGFQCSCKHPEYSLRDDRMSCKAKGGEMQYLFVFNNQIRTLTQSHSHLSIKYIDKNIDFKLAGLSVDFYRRYIYWTSEINNALFRINMDKSDTVQNVTLRHPSKISIDWMTGNIYVVEEGTQIQVCNFDIKQCALIYSTDPTRKIDALAVDPVTRTMFWSEHVKINLPFSKIYRSDLTGSNPVVVVNSDLELVSDIFIDSIRNVIYWAEQSKRVIERSTFNGTVRSIMFHIPDAPIDVAVFEDFAYFLVNSNNMLRRHALESHGNVWRCGLSGAVSYRCELIRISPPNFGLPYHLEIMHEALQPRGSNKCLNVTCDELCVVADVGPVCLCQDGSRIEMNGTCPETSFGRAAFGEKENDIPLGNSNKESSGKSKVWWLYTIVICLAVPSFMVFLYYCKIFSSGLLPTFCDKKLSFQSMHFDNTTYGLSAFNNSHSESQFHHTKLSPGDHRYENPLSTELSKSGIDSNVNNLEINQGKDNVMGWSDLAHSVEIVEDNGSESSSIEYSDVHLDDYHRAPLLQ